MKREAIAFFLVILLLSGLLLLTSCGQGGDDDDDDDDDDFSPGDDDDDDDDDSLIPWGGADSWISNNWGEQIRKCRTLNYCYIAPPTKRGSNRWEDNEDFLFVVLHGTPAGIQKFSDDYGNDNIIPSLAKTRDWTDSVVMLVPSYAGRIHNVEGLQDSILLNMIEGGNTGKPAYAVIAGTAAQYGNDIFNPASVCEADPCVSCLYDLFWDDMLASGSFGDAFLSAKREYLSRTDCGLCNYRLGHQTVFYGDPTVRAS